MAIVNKFTEGNIQLSGPKPPAISASPMVRLILDKFARSRSKPAYLTKRSQMFIAMLTGSNNAEVARKFDLHLDTPRLWRSRWLNLSPKLLQLESETKERVEETLASFLETALKDKARPGTPATFTPEQVAAIYALACEDPRLSGYSFEHWTPAELAREAIKRGIVETISPASIWRFLKRGSDKAASVPLLAQSARN